jgi:hypothetical protein
MATHNTEYRNIEEVYSDQGIVIDENSLWILKANNRLVLVDDDQYITTAYNHLKFKLA